MLDHARLRTVSVRVNLTYNYLLIALALGDCLIPARLDLADGNAIDVSLGLLLLLLLLQGGNVVAAMLDLV